MRQTRVKLLFSPSLAVLAQAFEVEISPTYRTMAQIGSSVSLTCKTTGCVSPSFSWRTQIDSPLSAKIRKNGTASILTMDPVSFENERFYVCTVYCESGKLERGIQVDIYCKCLQRGLVFSRCCLKKILMIHGVKCI